MQVRPRPKQTLERDNGFGFLRLLFASLVIVAHTPEIRDGNRSRELLTQVFHSLSFGELAVDGFFVISGYLITCSYLQSRSLKDYMIQRVRRIFPGFLAAYLVCILIVAPLGQIEWVGTLTERVSVALGALMLRQPSAGAVFAGTPYPVLNGATWTIVLEFQCYVLIALLGLSGLMRRRTVMLGLAFAVSLIAVAQHVPPAGYFYQEFRAFDLFSPIGLLQAVFDLLVPSSRLVAVYLIGACFYLYRDHLRFSRPLTLLAIAGLLAGLYSGRFADIGFALFGGYLILHFAQAASGTVFARINNRNDVSYGVYLYAWPVEKLIMWYWPDLPLLLTGVLTFAAAFALGWISWLSVERPAMRRTIRGDDKYDLGRVIDRMRRARAD